VSADEVVLDSGGVEVAQVAAEDAGPELVPSGDGETPAEPASEPEASAEDDADLEPEALAEDTADSAPEPA
jgi:hypothetical protein